MRKEAAIDQLNLGGANDSILVNSDCGLFSFGVGGRSLGLLSATKLEAFRELANGRHPRLLSMFKASLLLSDDEEICGSELVELDLAHFEAIVFDGNPFIYPIVQKPF